MAKLYLNIILTLLFAALIYFGIAVVNSNDRAYQSNRQMLAKLDQLSTLSASMPATSSTVGAVAEDLPAVANVQFFDPEAVPGGRLIQVFSADTRNMNTLVNNDNTAATFNALCNSSLAERNYAAPEEFQPMLAESWTISPDHKSYHIKLRKGVMWQDFTDPVSGVRQENVEVTAHDFKFYLDVIKNPDTNCAPLRVYYQDLTDIEILNDYEFIVRWDKSYYGSLSSTLSLSPLPRQLYHAYDGPFDPEKFNNDHQRNRIIVGCGPYQFVKWDKDVRVIFRKFDRYWGKKYGVQPPLEYLVFELIKHPNTAYQALVSKKIDKLNLTPDQWTQRTGSEEFRNADLRKYRYLSNSYSYIGYNLRNPLFQDRRVRQALTQLVDRQKILESVYRNEAKIITGPFFPESKYYDSSITPWPFDVAAAKKLLAEAGWRDLDANGILEKDGREFSFTMLQVASHPIQEKMLPMIKETMALAGVDMKIQTVEWSVYVQMLEKRNFEACTLAWTTPFDPDPYQLWHSAEADKEGSSNHIAFKNPEADRLIEELRITFDLEKRLKLTHQLHQLFHEEQPYTFLFSSYSLNAISNRYQNFQVFPSGLASDILWTPKAMQLNTKEIFQ